VRAFFEKAETAETAPQGRASVQRLPEKATLGQGLEGRGRYVPMPACFGKARRVTFEDFVTA